MHSTFIELAIYWRQAPAGVFFTFFNNFRIGILFIYGGSLLGNEVADDLAKAATSNPVDPKNHMVLTSTEIYSRAKELIKGVF
ncbi:hypothetical protein TNCV_1472681 [Trichonephila clavipes]|nr:hypothetical protein TNCV_1472681 [Trichonephila clavipes]